MRRIYKAHWGWLEVLVHVHFSLASMHLLSLPLCVTSAKKHERWLFCARLYASPAIVASEIMRDGWVFVPGPPPSQEQAVFLMPIHWFGTNKKKEIIVNATRRERGRKPLWNCQDIQCKLFLHFFTLLSRLALAVGNLQQCVHYYDVYASCIAQKRRDWSQTYWIRWIFFRAEEKTQISEWKSASTRAKKKHGRRDSRADRPGAPAATRIGLWVSLVTEDAQFQRHYDPGHLSLRRFRGEIRPRVKIITLRWRCAKKELRKRQLR